MLPVIVPFIRRFPYTFVIPLTVKVPPTSIVKFLQLVVVILCAIVCVAAIVTSSTDVGTPVALTPITVHVAGAFQFPDAADVNVAA